MPYVEYYAATLGEDQAMTPCPKPMRYLNIHTHYPRENSLVNCTPTDFYPQPHYTYSVGIHPWQLSTTQAETWEKLKRLASHPQVLAIGETGLDKCIPTRLEEQLKAFTSHKRIAEKTQKPLIIHLVKYYNEFLNWVKQEQPSIPLLIHGFRGKPQLAEQLLVKGCYLSLGEHYNTESLAAIPIDKLFLETDASTFDIKGHYKRIAQAKHITTQSLIQQIEDNYITFFRF